MSNSKPAMGFDIVGFLMEVRQELRQVTWPTSKQVINLTSLVLIISLIAGSLLGGLDYLFVQLTGLLIR